MRRVLIVAAFALVMTGCASLPPLEGRVQSRTVADTAGTRLARALAEDIAAHPGQTGIHVLAEPREAFAARVVLATGAEKSIDAQYYIWHGDQAGTLLFEALWQAAERGVRVRLLLDDMNTGGLDPTIAALDDHPNIEVRLYNPFAQRSLRGLALLGDFSRLNRRMHNKSFTVDNQVAVVGGRNVGNEYYAAGTGTRFADLDVIAVGAVVPEVSRQFDLYWNSPSAYPATTVLGAPGPGAGAELQDRFAATRADPESVAFVDAVRTAPIIRDLLGRQLAFEWTTARLFFDDPAKTLDATDRIDQLLLPQLIASIGQAQRSFDLVTPYFVPGEAGTAALVEQARQGVKLRILTNSLAASDVSAVHAGYAKRRTDLARAGIQLFELKPTAAAAAPRGKAADGSSGSGGSGGSGGLHAKTFAVDGRVAFVGSFNFDPRSARLNTELGLVIDSPVLARQMAGWFDNQAPLDAYEVRLGADGQSVEWIERSPAGEEQRHTTEPGTSAFKRFGVGVLSVLPIEWLL